MKNSVKHILWAYAFLLFILAYIFGLFIDLTGDSGLYATIAKQMVESGNWMTLKINGELYDQKPHLLFWLAGIGIKLFGNTNFAFKIFPALWALAGVYFTYRLGKLLYSETAGKFAALIAGTSQIFMLYLLDIHTDSILQTGVILATWQLAAYLKTKKPFHFILGFAGVGLSMLSKGPVGAVVPFFVVLLYFIFQREYRQIFHLKWILGIIISLVITSPALVHLYKNFGFEGIRFFFITNNFGRISGEYAGSSNDPFYYFYNAIWAFLPWTMIVFFAVFSEVKSWFSKNKKDIWGISLLGSVMIFTLILSVAKGKAPNYFLLVVPVISVISGKWIKLIYDSKKWNKLVIIQRIFVIVLWAFFVFVIYFFRKINVWVPIVLLTFVFVTAVISERKVNVKFDRIVLNSIILCGSVYLYMNLTVIPELFSYQATPQVLEIFQRDKNSDDKLYNYHTEDFELFYYSEDSVREIHNSEDYKDMLQRNGAWLYTTKGGYVELLKYAHIDSTYFISFKGMNNLDLEFLNPATREASKDTTYLIHID